MWRRYWSANLSASLGSYRWAGIVVGLIVTIVTTLVGLLLPAYQDDLLWVAKPVAALTAGWFFASVFIFTPKRLWSDLTNKLDATSQAANTIDAMESAILKGQRLLEVYGGLEVESGGNQLRMLGLRDIGEWIRETRAILVERATAFVPDFDNVDAAAYGAGFVSANLLADKMRTLGNIIKEIRGQHPSILALSVGYRQNTGSRPSS